MTGIASAVRRSWKAWARVKIAKGHLSVNLDKPPNQGRAFLDGKSKLDWPHSKHNRTPSLAVDIAPYPIDWKDTGAFMVLRGFVLARAAALGLKVGVISWDMPHFQLNNAT